MRIVNYIIDHKATKTRKNSPIDPDFFDYPKKMPPKPCTSGPKLRDLFQEDLSLYWDTFLKCSDRRAYNTKLGYWEGENEARDWRAVLMKYRKPGQQPYVRATGTTSSARSNATWTPNSGGPGATGRRVGGSLSGLARWAASTHAGPIMIWTTTGARDSAT